MRKQWTFVLAIVAGIGLGTWWLVQKGKSLEPVEVGNQVPNFRALNLKTRDTVSFRQVYQGKVVLVNLWGTFCIPCRKEMPAMERLYQEFHPQGFEIAAVSVDEGDLQGVVDFAQELKLTFDILHDSDGSVQKAFQTVMFPESFLVGKDGQIVKKAIGEHPWSSEANRRIVAQLLGVTLPPVDSAATPTKPAGG